MTNQEAAYILDPETTRQALAPYSLDCQAKMAVVNEACAVAAKVLRETGWISVKDKMPPTGVRVLVCRKTRSGKAVEPGIAGFDGFFTVPVGRTKNVTHWMPMPKAISPSPSSKLEWPTSGTMQGVSAKPTVRTLSPAFLAAARTSSPSWSG